LIHRSDTLLRWIRVDRAHSGDSVFHHAERPKIHLSEIELAAAGFREALHSERGVEALRGCL
jgi:hypothetical protein